MRRHVCVVLVNRANYARVQTVLEALRADKAVKLTIVVSSSALLRRFGRVVDVIRSDGFEVNEMVWSSIEGDTPETMSRSVGLSILDLSSIFGRVKPDVVLTVADRYETIATAIAARFMNIPVAHTQGGEVSGSIDESVRHSVSKLANIHFPATQESAKNLKKMGEHPDTIHMLGCPSIDLAARADLALPEMFFRNTGGVGSEIDQAKPYVVVSQHPVTTEFGLARTQIVETLQAMKTVAHEGVQIIWLWPNIDAGSDVFSNEIRSFREWDDPSGFRFYKNS
jgi:UDP-hydrolysing UDP-N-acetyl-D-glucosamine 2-epimerase